MKKIIYIVILLFISVSIFGQIHKEINVGIYDSPPFLIKKDSNKYEGICIDILNYLEDNTDIKFIINEYEPDIESLINRLQKGSIDMVAGSMTINSDRLKRINFTQPYYITNLSIAQINKQASFLKTILILFSVGTMKVIFWICILLFLMGAIFWHAERGTNPQFRENFLGVFDGFYYAIVVMTTVGFGDKVTITPYGKTVSVLWMMVSTWVMSFFVAGITSTMTVERMNDVIDNIQDLKSTKVASIVGTTSGKFLDENGVKYIMYNNVKEGFDAIINKELETFVYDTPILKYYMKSDKYSGLILSNKKYQTQYYGFGLRNNFVYKNKIDQLILEFINSPEWNNILRKYNLNE